MLHQAIARINYLHEPYIRSLQITNSQMIYTLSTCITEPIRFLGQFEWRKLSDMELAAHATFWKYIGEMMGADYTAELGKKEWKDGIEFYQDMCRWAQKYEYANVRPLEEVRMLGGLLLDIILSAHLPILRPLVVQGFLVVLGDRMRAVLR